MNDRTEHNHDGWSFRAKIAFAVFAAIGGFFLVAEHRAHVVYALPWLFLGACALMHLFMHHGHGAHGGGRRHGGETSSDSGTGRPPGTDLRDDATVGADADRNLHPRHGGRP